MVRISHFLITVAFSFIALVAAAQSNTSALLPMPNHIEQGKGFFRLSDKTQIKSGLNDDGFGVSLLQGVLKSRMQTSVAESGEKGQIELAVNPSLQGREHYILTVTKNKITLEGASDAAVYYAIQTLDQILMGDVCHTANKQIAAVKIDDAPRFGYRALMLDPARHFLPVEDVKFYIDQMFRYKYNVLQLHLTDDQGWRMEIRQYPQLTEKGAFRNPKGGKNGPDNGYYTQAELKDLIAYAAQRNIEIVPELDIPGHTVAALAAFRELGCTHTDTMQIVVGTTDNLMLCANTKKVYEVYDGILREVAEVFPSKHIHLGGDEAAIERNWTKCDRCQALMKDLGYTKPAQLMNYFFGKILNSVRKYGKEPMLWCELDNIRMPANEYLFDYPQDATLITWRNGLTPKCLELTARHGNRLIMAPGEYAYFDYPQWKGDLPEFNNWGMPTTPLEKVYQFDPGYGLPASGQSHILGVMGTLWGEAIKDIARATYMTYPRGLALSEAGWTQMEHRDWNSFRARLYPNLSDLMKKGVSVRVPFEIAEGK